jgi:putative ABC transport system permease protein
VITVKPLHKSLGLLVKMALRNVFRQKRRSFLTGLTMIGGFVLLSLSISISDGTYDTAIETFTSFGTGQVQVHKQGYLDNPTLYNAITDPDQIGKQLTSVRGVEAWSPRLYSGVLAFIGKKTMLANLTGIDPDREAQTTRILQKIRQGRFLSAGSQNEVMIGADLADILKAKLGDELVLIAQAADGSIANDIFRIVAILKSGSNTGEDRNCYLPIGKAQDFLALPGKVHEIAVVLQNFRRSRQAAAQIAVALNDPTLDVEPWEVVQKQFYQAMTVDKEGMWITFLIIVAIVAIGVLNTVLMAILERTREYGILKALGTRPADIFALILLETGFLALLSVAVSVLISLGVNFYMSVHGISYPTPITMGGIIISNMRGVVNLRSFAWPAGITFFTAVLVSIFPAIHALRVKPVPAMRQ